MAKRDEGLNPDSVPQEMNVIELWDRIVAIDSRIKQIRDDQEKHSERLNKENQEVYQKINENRKRFKRNSTRIEALSEGFKKLAEGASYEAEIVYNIIIVSNEYNRLFESLFAQQFREVEQLDKLLGGLESRINEATDGELSEQSEIELKGIISRLKQRVDERTDYLKSREIAENNIKRLDQDTRDIKQRLEVLEKRDRILDSPIAKASYIFLGAMVVLIALKILFEFDFVTTLILTSCFVVLYVCSIVLICINNKKNNNNYNHDIDDSGFSFEGNLIDDSDEEADDVVEIVDEYIDRMTHVATDEVLKYEYKAIHPQAYIEVEGTLEIDNCILYYNEELGDEITLNENAKMIVTNSLIVCNGYDSKPFINCKKGSELVFEGDSFEDCSCFINASTDVLITINNCKMKNCYSKFVDASNIEFNMSNCDIEQNELCRFNAENRESRPVMFRIFGDNDKVNIVNTRVAVSEGFDLHEETKHYGKALVYFYAPYGCIKSSSFSGMKEPVKASVFEDNRFDDCIGCIANVDFPSQKTTITECVFNNCTDVICVCNNDEIKYCQFVDCNNRVIYTETDFLEGVRVFFCHFINTRVIKKDPMTFDFHSSIELSVSNLKSGRVNTIEKCLFDGAKMDDYYLIGARKCINKPPKDLFIVQECDFRNISSNRLDSRVVDEQIKYTGIIAKEKHVEGIRVSSCRGLEDVRSETGRTDDYEMMTVSKANNPIGFMPAVGTVIGTPFSFRVK